MPRQPRLDTPNALHHVIGRGINELKIFVDREDREDFLIRLKNLCENKAISIYAWALMDNHFHLLVRTGNISLSRSMRKLLTGYVVNYNRRHRRYGHLFQNRYKSILCENDPYLLELTRYIHLNPLRAGLVKDILGLREYRWSGHSSIMGNIKREWQDVEGILLYFGKSRKRARERYEEWILGSSEFVKNVIADVEEKDIETLRLNSRISDLVSLARDVCIGEGVKESDLRSGSRRKYVVRSRRIYCQLAVSRMGYSGADVARFLGITTSAVNRLAVSVELPEIKQYG
jgi:putative transposase